MSGACMWCEAGDHYGRRLSVTDDTLGLLLAAIAFLTWLCVALLAVGAPWAVWPALVLIPLGLACCVEMRRRRRRTRGVRHGG